MKIFVDDERFPVEETGWTIVRTEREFLDLLAEIVQNDKKVDFISFDHDLGDDVFTGFRAANLLVDADMDFDVLSDDFDFYVHSQNPVGAENIRGLLDRYLTIRSDSLNSQT